MTRFCLESVLLALRLLTPGDESHADRSAPSQGKALPRFMGVRLVMAVRLHDFVQSNSRPEDAVHVSKC